MFKLIFNTGLLIAAVAVFFLPGYGISAKYAEVQTVKKEIAEYQTAADNARKLTEQRDAIQDTYNSFSPEEKKRLDLILPDNIDSVRYILEVEDIGRKFGMPIKDVNFSANKSVADGDVVIGAKEKPYGVFTFQFSTEGKFSDFLLLLESIEKNLRIMDIQGISFSSGDGTTSRSLFGGQTQSQASDIYSYQIKMQSYWLK